MKNDEPSRSICNTTVNVSGNPYTSKVRTLEEISLMQHSGNRVVVQRSRGLNLRIWMRNQDPNCPWNASSLTAMLD